MPLLLYFFRFAGCPTARRDLAMYAEAYNRVTSVGAAMAAISADTIANHATLVRNLGLPFPVLSDADFTVSEAYAVYRSDETEEGPQPHGEPAVYILDVDGRIAYSQVQSGPKGTALPAEMVLVLYYMAQNGGRY